ncbi:hypothetical protein OH76DRAFT_627140 [Lentinus brumalis]|uniref:Uncharacterized protein n=1 Tax=Lentinus brumalis TaxID=2498619 RepID=A0A371D8B0_9APHY|nr:hypothetical protein OH76DRAFT_627140 [Polyporus brumalis]
MIYLECTRPQYSMLMPSLTSPLPDIHHMPNPSRMTTHLLGPSSFVTQVTMHAPNVFEENQEMTSVSQNSLSPCIDWITRVTKP